MLLDQFPSSELSLLGGSLYKHLVLSCCHWPDAIRCSTPNLNCADFCVLRQSLFPPERSNNSCNVINKCFSSHAFTDNTFDTAKQACDAAGQVQTLPQGAVDPMQ